MPGLLDFLSGDGPQQQGLLAAAAKMLQDSGPSATPVSFGQVVGGGIGAYQQSLAKAAEQQRLLEQHKQQQALFGLKLQDAQSDLSNQEATRKRQREIDDELSGLGFGQPGGAMPAAQMGGGEFVRAASNAGLPGDNGTLNQIVDGVNRGQSPQAAAGGIGGASPAGVPNMAPQPGQQPGQPVNPRAAAAAQLMAEAEIYRKHGDSAGATARRAEALKLMPEFSQTPQIGNDANGKPVLYVLDKDANPKVLNGLSPREKMSIMQLGGTSEAYNEYALKPGQTFKHTPTIADSISRERLNFDKSQTGKPVFNADAGGFITPPSAAKPNGAIVPLPGFTKPDKPLTVEQGKATTFVSRMQDAEAITKRLEKIGVSGSDFATIAAGSPLTNWAATEEGQMYRQAQENWVTANLRQESGAAIPKDEMNKDIRKYFPVVGDKPGNVTQKARAREIATRGMLVQAGPGAKQVPGIVGDTGGPSADSPPASKPTMAQMPTANASNKGKVLVDHQTGKRFKSNGMQWQEVQ